MRIRPLALAIFVAAALVVYAVTRVCQLPGACGTQGDPLSVVGLALALGGAAVYYLASLQLPPAPRPVRVRQVARLEKM